jgi:hypothetical protein
MPTRRDSARGTRRRSRSNHTLQRSRCYQGNIADGNRSLGQELANRATVVGRSRLKGWKGTVVVRMADAVFNPVVIASDGKPAAIGRATPRIAVKMEQRSRSGRQRIAGDDQER